MSVAPGGVDVHNRRMNELNYAMDAYLGDLAREAAVTVEEGIAALRTERDELVIQNERLGNDIVAAEARCARLQQALSHALDCKGPYDGTVSENGGHPAICQKCATEAREALAKVEASL